MTWATTASFVFSFTVFFAAFTFNVLAQKIFQVFGLELSGYRFELLFLLFYLLFAHCYAITV